MGRFQQDREPSTAGINVPTKESKRQAKGLVEALETRLHAGPPVCETEILSVREFLRQHDFSSASDYFGRLVRIREQMITRPVAPPQEKRNYGGKAAGCWMQLQSVYDHVILSTCHEGDFNLRRGRVKISHRFNRAGRIDFVELKLLRSLQPGLDGAIRKLLTIKDYPGLHKDWQAAEAYALRVLPQELVFLFTDIFRCHRPEILGWLINIGHRTVADLLDDLRERPANNPVPSPDGNPNQLNLEAVLADDVALPILEQAAAMESVVEPNDPQTVIVRYTHKPLHPVRRLEAQVAA